MRCLRIARSARYFSYIRSCQFYMRSQCAIRFRCLCTVLCESLCYLRVSSRSVGLSLAQLQLAAGWPEIISSASPVSDRHKFRVYQIVS